MTDETRPRSATWPARPSPAVVVTGAGGGIGRAVSVVFARQGHDLVLTDLDNASLRQTVSVVEPTGVRVTSTVADVSEEAQVLALFDLVATEHETLGVLVNVAGTGGVRRRIDEVSLADWQQLMAVNLTSAFLCSRSAAPQMAAGRGGVIINVSSVHARASLPGMAPYAVSKAGLVALTRALALDFAGKGIRAVAVLPGGVRTPILERRAQELGVGVEDLGFPADPDALGRLGSPDEVAEACAFIASPAASLVNGSTVLLDAGNLATLL